MWWSTSSGRIELNITKKVAAMCHHSGNCEPEVRAAMKIPSIKRQLNKLDPKLIVSELKEFGAWDDEELKDNEFNKVRLLWIACGDIDDKR